MIYLLIAIHSVQFGQSKMTQKFIKYVEEIIKKHRIELVAEETSEDVLKNIVNMPIMKMLSIKHNIPYLPCDEDDIECKKLGLLTTKELVSLPSDNELFQKNLTRREFLWFKKLKQHLNKRVLMLIVPGHHSDFNYRKEAFNTLLKENAVEFQTLPQSFVTNTL